MTSNITIAGETLTSEDWPEGCPGFEFVECYDPANNWMLQIKHPHFHTHDIWQKLYGQGISGQSALLVPRQGGGMP